MRRGRLKLVAIVCALAAFGLAGLWVAGDRLSAPVNHSVGAPPAGLPAAQVEFASDSGSTLAGAEDLHTTREESRRLFAAAREPKELWVVEGAAHTDLHAAAREEYERRVLDFFAKTLHP